MDNKIKHLGPSILYQAYGSIDIINECKYSLLRLLDIYAENEKPQIILYTDQKDEFRFFIKGLKIVFKEVDQEKILQWKGDINFVHRVKIEVIKDAMQSSDGNLLYCDTDTYCQTTLEPIFNSLSTSDVFFHLKEGIIENDFRKWTKFFNNNHSKLLKQFDPLAIEMWNAGVIALHKSHEDLLNEVLALTDEIYLLFPKHTVEQFSFCYTFQKQGIKISAAESFIFHYWDLKEFRILLDDFFRKHQSTSLEQMVLASRTILPEKILPSKMRFKKSGYFFRLLKSLSGNNWNIKQHFLSSSFTNI